MQDTHTGNLVPLQVERLFEAANQPQLESMERIRPVQETLQKAKDEAIPDRSRQGAVFSVGEIVTVKGGKFKVHAITEKRLYLDSLPS